VTRSPNRRVAVLVAGAAVVTGLVVAGCSAGRTAETSQKKPSVAGANAQTQVRNAAGDVIGTVSVRDVLVPYKDSKGYSAGGDAPLQLVVFNDTPQAVRVRVSSPATPDSTGAVSAKSVEVVDSSAPAATPSATAGPSASASPSPSAPPSPRPAVIEVPAQSYVILNEASGRYPKLVGLDRALLPGMAAHVVFEVDNADPIKVVASMGAPRTPVARLTPSAEPGEGH
jgi:hypothetical protein